MISLISQKSDEELKKIALDFVRGLIFTDRHLENLEDIKRVFLPIVFLSEAQYEKLVAGNPQFFYEYYSKAVRLSVKGYPCFFTVNWLNAEDTKKMLDYYLEIREFTEKTMLN